MKSKLMILGLISSAIAQSQNFNPIAPNDAFFNPLNGYVAIGLSTPSYKLDVSDDDNSPGDRGGNFLYTSNSAGAAGIGIFGTAQSLNNAKTNIGVRGFGSGVSSSNLTAVSVGVEGRGSGGGNNYGGIFVGSGSTNSTSGKNIGVWGNVVTNGAFLNTGIYGDDGGLSNADAGYFKGNLRAVNSFNNDSRIILDNIGAGGQAWSINSHNTASSPSGSHFTIKNGTGNNMLTILANSRVSIGTTAPSSRFEVNEVTNGPSSAGRFYMESSSLASGTGVIGIANKHTTDNFGVRGETGSNAGSGINAGVYGLIGASGGVINTAVYGDANGFTGLNDWACYFLGRTYSSSGGWTASDKRFKKNITKLNNVSDKLSSIKGYNYEFKTDEFKKKNFESGTQFGFIAQELKEIFPELVTEDGQGYLAVNYIGMIPVLLEGFKEQQMKIETLEKQLNIQKQNLSGNPISSGSDNKLFDKDFEMSQNIPNPFTHETLVKYSLPANTSNAYITIFDLSGKQLSNLALDPKGNSMIITSEKLSPGMYIYSIVADGKLVDSKRMLVAEK